MLRSIPSTTTFIHTEKINELGIKKIVGNEYLLGSKKCIKRI